MSILPYLPSVLFLPNSNSVSLERILKKSIAIIEETADLSDETVCVNLEDLETLLKNLK